MCNYLTLMYLLNCIQYGQHNSQDHSKSSFAWYTSMLPMNAPTSRWFLFWLLFWWSKTVGPSDLEEIEIFGHAQVWPTSDPEQIEILRLVLQVTRSKVQNGGSWGGIAFSVYIYIFINYVLAFMPFIGLCYSFSFLLIAETNAICYDSKEKITTIDYTVWNPMFFYLHRITL